MAAPNSFSLTVCVLILSFLLINLSVCFLESSFHIHWKVSFFGTCGERESFNHKVTKWMDYNCSVPAICLQSTKKASLTKYAQSNQTRESELKFTAVMLCCDHCRTVYTTPWPSWSKKSFTAASKYLPVVSLIESIQSWAKNLQVV